MPEHELTTITTDRSASVIAAGIHTVKIIDAEEREGPSGPYWAIQCEIIGDDDPFAGKWLWTNISLSEKARWKLEELLDALLVPEGKEILASDFPGAVFRVDTEHDTYEGRTRSSITTFLPVADGLEVPIAASKEEDEDEEESVVVKTKKRKRPF